MISRWMMTVLTVGLLMLPTIFSVAQESTETPDAPVPGLTIHVVQRGDTLYRIALTYGTTTPVLAELNRLTNVSNIQVGQRLLIPADDASVSEIETTIHIVQAGETLNSLAVRYGTTVEALIAVNEIANASQIYVGQELLIVVNNDESTVIASPAPDSTGVPGVSVLLDGNLHTVQRGETLFRIASQYGLDVTVLSQANNITDPTRIYAGQQLIIPGGTGEDAPVLDLPDPMTNLRVKPLIFTEGETGSIQISTQPGTTVTGQFLNRDLNLAAIDDSNYVVLVGIPRFTESGIYPVALQFTTSADIRTDYQFNIRVRAGAYGAQGISISEELAPLLAPAAQDYETGLLARITNGATGEKRYDGTVGLPAAAAMNSPYGTFRTYNDGAFTSYHSGADFASPPGAAIFAAANGRVVLADVLNIRGNTIVLDHGWGFYTAYAHLNELTVNLGDNVVSGQVIGQAGATGRVTGPHLHWEAYINGVAVNPLQWTQTSFP